MARAIYDVFSLCQDCTFPAGEYIVSAVNRAMQAWRYCRRSAVQLSAVLDALMGTSHGDVDSRSLSLSLSLCLSVSIERRKIQSSDRRKRRINSWREIAGVRSRQSRWWMGVEQLRDGGYRGWLWRQWVLMKAGWDADRFSCHCEITSGRVDVACWWWRLMTRRAERYAWSLQWSVLLCVVASKRQTPRSLQ